MHVRLNANLLRAFLVCHFSKILCLYYRCNSSKKQVLRLAMWNELHSHSIFFRSTMNRKFDLCAVNNWCHLHGKQSLSWQLLRTGTGLCNRIGITFLKAEIFRPVLRNKDPEGVVGSIAFGRERMFRCGWPRGHGQDNRPLCFVKFTWPPKWQYVLTSFQRVSIRYADVYVTTTGGEMTWDVNQKVTSNCIHNGSE